MFKRLTRKDSINILFLVLSALLIRCIFRHPFTNNGIVVSDAVFYTDIANNIIRNWSLGVNGLWNPPLYGIAIAIFYPLIHDLFTASIFVSTLAGSLLVIPVFLLARALFDRKTGYIAAVLTICYPHLIITSTTSYPSSLYTLLLLSAFYFMWKGYSKRSILSWLLAGALFALAYLSRSEGLFVFAFTLFFYILLSLYKRELAKILIPLCLTIIMFFMVASPYLVHLKNNYGVWTLSPKIGYVSIWMQSKIYGDGSEPMLKLWALTPDGKYGWQQAKGQQTTFDFIKKNPQKFFKIYKSNLIQSLPGNIPNSSGMEPIHTVYPVVFVLISTLGFFFLLSRKASVKENILLLFPFLVAFPLAVFTRGHWRYLVPYVPLLVIATAKGLVEIQTFLNRRFDEKYSSGMLQGNTFPVLFTFVTCLYFIFVVDSAQRYQTDYVKTKMKMGKAMIEAGEWAKQIFPEDTIFMVPWSKMAFYVGGQWIPRPHAEENRLVEFARQKKADYIVDVFFLRLDVRRLINRYPGAPLVNYYSSKSHPFTVLFYKVEK